MGSGQPVVFSHGWPLSSDAWEDAMFFFASHGYRTIAHDRRGNGRSSQPWTGNDVDIYADYFCIKVFSETDLTEDLEKSDVPTPIVHGDDDQIVPIADSALLSSKIVPNATLKIYEGAPHALPSTLKDRLNADLLEFIASVRQPAGAAH